MSPLPDQGLFIFHTKSHNTGQGMLHNTSCHGGSLRVTAQSGAIAGLADPPIGISVGWEELSTLKSLCVKLMWAGKVKGHFCIGLLLSCFGNIRVKGQGLTRG